MDRIAANRTPVAGQGKLNSRPLPNLIGHNGPYFGTVEPIEQDADRIEGHTELFRSLDTFEGDLKQAVLWVWEGMLALTRMRAQVAAGEDEIENLVTATQEELDEAFRLMQEALLIAEVLDERTARRIRERDRQDFLSLIASTPRGDMSALERLAEEGRINWQIAHLMNRLEVVAKDFERGKWSEDYLQGVFNAVERLDKSAADPGPDALQAMNDNELAAELRGLEERAHETRKTIALIHAIRTVRNA